MCSEGWPVWIKSFQREVFYKNGLTPSGEDLQCCLIELDGTPVTISFDHQNANVGVSEQTATLEAGRAHVVADRYRVTLLRSAEKHERASIEGTQHFVAVLSGMAEMNGQAVYTGQAVQANSPKVDMCLTPNSLALHIEETMNL